MASLTSLLDRFMGVDHLLAGMKPSNAPRPVQETRQPEDLGLSAEEMQLREIVLRSLAGIIKRIDGCNDRTVFQSALSAYYRVIEYGRRNHVLSYAERREFEGTIVEPHIRFIERYQKQNAKDN
jgi:hypothetical protein